MKYYLQYVFICFLFLIFKLLGYRASLFLSSHLFQLFGKFFRSKKVAYENIKTSLKISKNSDVKNIYRRMWMNYGKIFSEYLFIEKFRISKKYSKKINIKNQYILDEIKKNNEQVIFISGHFNNFELMAMQIEKSGIDLVAIYRPLNNIFLNPKMEKIRKKYICKNQIKKGMSGTRDLLKCFKKKMSVALMIDQRVSEGIDSKFFGKNALTTTIPAQLVKRFNTKIVPIYIERILKDNFNMTVYEPINFRDKSDISHITSHLNKILEEMILKNPDQWIWTHNRWKH